MDNYESSKQLTSPTATRKRRSSILKAGRAPRTPFSELEFNVATPTDTTKSRRVSFSRRTGVAEFVTNEATTTWKNFYEEHNKSLELSGNESAVKQQQVIGHIGKRVFDDQFTEFEAEIDNDPSLRKPRNRSVNNSLNNPNFTQQLADLDRTGDDNKLTAPEQKFDLSTVSGDPSKIFGDELTNPGLVEMSDKLNIDFSVVLPVESHTKDDLDDFLFDVQRQKASTSHSNVVCAGPFRERKDDCEYIEVDLDTTHAVINNNESEMSLDDTIYSPNVQDITSITTEKKVVSSYNKDWVADKENIVLNPYSTPKETEKFAVSATAEVLVFDGKKLTIVTETSAVASKENELRNMLLPESAKIPPRKTIVLNTNEDLPNLVDDKQAGLKNTIIYEDSDLSITQPLEYSNTERRKTIVYDDVMGDISITQALPSNILSEIKPVARQKTMVYENKAGDMSVTQTLPTNIVAQNKFTSLTEGKKSDKYDNDNFNISMMQAHPTNNITNLNMSGKQKTIFYENDEADISITRALPVNIMSKNGDTNDEKRKTILFSESINNISITESIPANIISEKRKTIMFEDDSADVSMTQVIPTNIILKDDSIKSNNQDISITRAMPVNILSKNGDTNDEKRKTILFSESINNISITESMPANIISEKRKTIMFEDDSADVSMTQVIPTNIILEDDSIKSNNRDISITQAMPVNILSINGDTNDEKRKTILFSESINNISITESIPANIISEKRKTIMFEDDSADVSMTQVIPTNIILKDDSIKSNNRDISITRAMPVNILSKNGDTNDEKRKTILFSESINNISITESIPANIISEKRKTIMFEDDSADVSMTQVIPTNIILKDYSIKSNNQDISVTRALPVNILSKNGDTNDGKRKTILFSESINNISITESIPANIISEKRKTIMFENDSADVSMTQVIPTNIILKDYSIKSNNQDISVTRALPVNILSKNGDTNDEKKKTILFSESINNISVTESIPANIISEKSKTIMFEHDAADVSMTQAIPTNIILKDGSIKSNNRNTLVFDGNDMNVSITQALPRNIILRNIDSSRQTVDITNETMDILINQTVPNNKVLNVEQKASLNAETSKRKSIAYSNSDIPLTMAFPNNIFLPNKSVKKGSSVDEDNTDKNKTQGDSILLQVEINQAKGKATVFKDRIDVSVKEVSPTDILLDKPVVGQKNESHNDNVTMFEIFSTKVCTEKTQERENTVVYEAELSISKPIPLALNVQHPNESLVENSVAKIKQCTQNITDNTQNILSDKHVLNSSCEPEAIVSNNLNNSLTNFTKVFEQERSVHEAFDMSITHDYHCSQAQKRTTDIANNEVIVYQAVTVQCKAKADDPEQIELTSKGSYDAEPNIDSSSYVMSQQDVIDKSKEVKYQRACEESPVAIKKEFYGITKNYIAKSKESMLLDGDVSMEFNKTENKEKYKFGAELVMVPSKDIGSVNIQALEHSPNLGLSELSDKSILNNLLDMSKASLLSNTDIKHVNNQKYSKNQTSPNTAEKMFIITHDTDDEIQYNTYKLKSNITGTDLKSPLPHQNKEKHPKIVESVKKKLAKLHSSLVNRSPKQAKESPNFERQSLKLVKESTKLALQSPKFAEENQKLAKKSPNPNGHFEKDVDESVTDLSNDSEEADNTQDLVEMLSKLTDSSPVVERKPASARQSMFSREELMSNISLAQAMLQKSRLELDEVSLQNDTATSVADSPVALRQHLRSRDVVKTLTYDDDDDATYLSPLRKSALGYPFGLPERRARVIPDFLRGQVTDGLKELMDDLVKPGVDEPPPCPAPCSTSVQASLTASSQLDLPGELRSPTASSQLDLSGELRSLTTSSQLGKLRSVTASSQLDLPGELRSLTASSQLDLPGEMRSLGTPSLRRSAEVNDSFRPRRQSPVPPPTLVFDESNPLNNVLLLPARPAVASVPCCSPLPSPPPDLASSTSPRCYFAQAAIADVYQRIDMDETIAWRASRDSMSSDRQSSPCLADREANTELAMPGTGELLKASSSLTFVDDVLREPLDEALADSDRTSDKDDCRIDPPTKAKKRTYSPVKRRVAPEVEVTPKPNSKLAKLSKSPRGSDVAPAPDDVEMQSALKQKPGNKYSYSVQRLHTELCAPGRGDHYDADCSMTQPCDAESEQDGSFKEHERSRVVQDVCARDHKRSPLEQDMSLRHERSPLERNVSERDHECSPLEQDVSERDHECSQLKQDVSARDRKYFPLERDMYASEHKVSHVERESLRTRIDALPYMGVREAIEIKKHKNFNREDGFKLHSAWTPVIECYSTGACAWGTCTADTWCWELVRARLLLTATLSGDRAELRLTRPSTGVDPVGVLCVQFAECGMRPVVEWCTRTEQLVTAVRRCGAAGERALRWGRRLQRARAHLALNVQPTGDITFKTANVPLRTVWEVRLRARWDEKSRGPRATDLAVTRLAGKAFVTPDNVARVTHNIASHWGHVTDTIWRVFRYLKHKRADDNLLFGV